MALPRSLLRSQDAPDGSPGSRRPFQIPLVAFLLCQGNTRSIWLLPHVPWLCLALLLGMLCHEARWRRAVSRQNGALNFWSCCLSWCFWTVRSHMPARGAELQLRVTLWLGSGFRGACDSLPVAGCWLSCDSAAESPSVSAVSAVPQEGTAWPGSARLWLRLPRCPRQVSVRGCPQPIQPWQPPPRRCCPQPWHLLAPPGSQVPRVAHWLIWIGLALRDPSKDSTGLGGAGFIPSLVFPHNTDLFLQPVISALLVASPLPSGCSLELGGSLSSSFPAGIRSPGTARGTGCCRDVQHLLWTEQPVSWGCSRSPRLCMVGGEGRAR